MPSIEPTSDQLQRFLDRSDDGRPLVMINLLRYRDRAEYPADAAATPCSGREAYERYGMAVTPMLTGCGGQILWRGTASAVVIGPAEEAWDEAILVQYPSRAAFLGMVTSAAYQAIVIHRHAALADSRLIATTTTPGAD